jgi:hypothetical protein
MGPENRYVYGPSPTLVDCERPDTEVDCETALAILEPYVKVAREEFLRFEREHYGGSKIKRVKLECAPWAELQEEDGFNVRNFAGTSEDGRMIVAAPELVELPEDSVAAIIAHEFGHTLDYLYPGRFLLAQGELVRFDDPGVGNSKAEKARIARMRQWQLLHQDRDLVEQVADEIASLVLHRQIRYAGPCLLQTFGRGLSRPPGLR